MHQPFYHIQFEKAPPSPPFSVIFFPSKIFNLIVETNLENPYWTTDKRVRGYPGVPNWLYGYRW